MLQKSTYRVFTPGAIHRLGSLQVGQRQMTRTGTGIHFTPCPTSRCLCKRGGVQALMARKTFHYENYMAKLSAISGGAAAYSSVPCCSWRAPG